MTAYPECARIFFDHRIDFCFRSERTLDEACAEQGLVTAVILDLLSRSAADLGSAVPEARALFDP